ncbi:hypothetical protein HUT18_15530 [Streptomyces sp. NA04227]|uniref:hypothetical protein n=1 Tax=Streptomyces sp. NA04227 TaxID=2742136 RepID=UPI001590B102|nr:hypothetical protein [Streptomyces sp. NA04227]QKW07579.1 hypothetical protein HUT18_15530 [Streptomyces sp. NA04227]
MARNPHTRVLLVVAAVLAFVLQTFGAGSTAFGAHLGHETHKRSTTSSSGPSTPEKESEKLPGARIAALGAVASSRSDDPGAVPRTGGPGFRYVSTQNAEAARPAARHPERPCITALQVFRC